MPTLEIDAMCYLMSDESSEDSYHLIFGVSEWAGGGEKHDCILENFHTRCLWHDILNIYIR